MKKNISNCIYVIESGGGYCKIGITRNPSTRIKSVAYGTGLKITKQMILSTNIDAKQVEASMHKSLKSSCVFGEWFTIDFGLACECVQLTLSSIDGCKYKNVTSKELPLDGDCNDELRRITTADIRKNSNNWSGNFIIDKMKQGRDKITDKTFVVIEVPAGVAGDATLDYASVYLKNEIDNRGE